MVYRWIYTLLFALLLPAILLRLLYRSLKAPAYRQRWAERFGCFRSVQFSGSPVWVHAVSVGETLAALPLIKALQQQYPDSPLVITTTTPTGSERVKALFADALHGGHVFHVYVPYDLPWLLGIFLKQVNPRLLVIMETELWPNMIHSCFVRKIPVLLANARLSEKSARGYARVGPLTELMLREISRIAVQTQQEGERFIQLGLSREKLCITGSIKFDLDLSAEIRSKAALLKQNWSGNNRRCILLAASTHPGEDEIIIKAFVQWKQQFADLLLVLVPRHPERFNTVYHLCVQSGFKTRRRSELREPPSTSDVDADIILGDTMGELLAFYGACDIAFVGGSLLPVGGHNLIEPAAWAKPVVCGKYLFNFSEVSILLAQQQAIVICESAEDLQREVAILLQDETKRRTMGNAAQKIANENRGALQRLMLVITQLIK